MQLLLCSTDCNHGAAASGLHKHAFWLPVGCLLLCDLLYHLVTEYPKALQASVSTRPAVPDSGVFGGPRGLECLGPMKGGAEPRLAVLFPCTLLDSLQGLLSLLRLLVSGLGYSSKSKWLYTNINEPRATIRLLQATAKAFDVQTQHHCLPDFGAIAAWSVTRPLRKTKGLDARTLAA